MKIVSLKSDDGKQEIATSLQGKLFKQRSFQHQHVRIRSMHLSLIYVYVSKLKKYFLTVFIAESLFSLILINRWWWHLLWATIVQLYSEKIFCTSENYLARNCHNPRPSPSPQSKVKCQMSKDLEWLYSAVVPPTTTHHKNFSQQPDIQLSSNFHSRLT